MNCRNVILFVTIFIYSLFHIQLLHAQLKPAPKVKDSLAIYKKIETFTGKRKITKKLYEQIFRSTPTTPAPAAPAKKTKSTSKKAKKKIKIRPLEYYEGKIIRNINIKTLDPLGYSINDTSSKPKSLLEKSGDFIHIKSKKSTIRNHLLFRRGDTLDPLKIKESERIIRSSAYVRDAIITVVGIPQSNDSVDVNIIMQDRWSLNGGGSISPNSFSTEVSQTNFLGLGHQIRQGISSRGLGDSILLFRGGYSIPYIRNSFITVNGYYDTDRFNKVVGLVIDRPFFSPLTKWAAGIDLARYQLPRMFSINDSTAREYMLDFLNYDMWFGKSFSLSKEKTIEERSTSLILSARYVNQNYYQSLPKENDQFGNNQTNQGYFVSAGISRRGYYKDKYIYRFGTTEDVPTGLLVSSTFSISNRSIGSRFYAGFKAGWAHHLPARGYWSILFEAGSYFRNQFSEQGVVRTGVAYFTELIPFGKWRIRQFLGAESMYGLARGRYERITINSESGLRGFDSPALSGTNKLVVYSQTLIYLPYNLIGFRFAPILYFGLGTIGSDDRNFLKSKIYPAIALGVQIRNENLVFDTFQFTFGFYPDVPGRAGPTFKFNPLRSYDLQFRNYQIGRPGEIPYY